MANQSGAALVPIYPDDFLISGPRSLCVVVHHQLAQLFGCGQEATFDLRDFVGLEREVLGVDAEGTKAVRLHQTKYARYIVEQYERKYCCGRALRHVSTPLATAEDRKALETVAGHVPLLGAPAAAELNGQLMWVARGTRADVAFGTQRVSRRLSCWERVIGAPPPSLSCARLSIRAHTSLSTLMLVIARV